MSKRHKKVNLAVNGRLASGDGQFDGTHGFARRRRRRESPDTDTATKRTLSPLVLSGGDCRHGEGDLACRVEKHQGSRSTAAEFAAFLPVPTAGGHLLQPLLGDGAVEKPEKMIKIG
jgi:hypothetical protein